MKEMNSIYKKRIEWVIEHINNHLGESLALDDLARVACFSPYHFHRIFVAITGETVHNFTNRLRVEKAARLLKYSQQSILSVALDAGFSSSATFSRSFKNYFGITPKEFRKRGDLVNSKICKDLYPINQHLAPVDPRHLESVFPIEIKKLSKRRVAYIRVVNSFQEGVVLDAYQQMITWATELGIYNSQTIFGMSLDDLTVTPKDKYRYEVCLTIPDSLKVDHDVISVMHIPQCRYATTVVSGDINQVATAYDYLYNHWLVNSSYEPEHQHTLEVFLDKFNVCSWNHFELELCLPIKPLLD
ncbi:MAG: AraC family transcriptional regulator [Bacteroidota bacterium]